MGLRRAVTKAPGRVMLVFALCAGAGLARADDAIAIAPGKGRFTFVDPQGDPAKRMDVFTFRPDGIDASIARIVFVMHGHGKDADKYRDTWVDAARRGGFIVIAPAFDTAQWPHGAYSWGSVSLRDGTPLDRSRWSYSVIEHLFDAVRIALGDATPRYYLYGHSEGAQFVHRLVLLLPDARYARAVAANAGWYTMPRYDVHYPFGLEGSPLAPDALGTSLGRDLVVLLGARDINPNHSELNRSAQAEAQGPNRFERGQAFFATAQAQAARLGTSFGWRLRVVPGAAHQNSRMAGPAATLLMEVAP